MCKAAKFSLQVVSVSCFLAGITNNRSSYKGYDFYKLYMYIHFMFLTCLDSLLFITSGNS